MDKGYGKVMVKGDLSMKGTVPQRGMFRSIRTKLIVSFCVLFAVVWGTVEFMHLKGIPFTTNRGWQGH